MLFRQLVCFYEITFNAYLFYRRAKNGLVLDEGHNVACQEVVSSLYWLVHHHWVVLAHVMTKLQVVILPGAASMRLLIVGGTTHTYIPYKSLFLKNY